MGESTPAEKNDKFQKIEDRIDYVLTNTPEVKTAYSDLRNLYSVITNDIKSTAAKKLSKTLGWARTIIAENLKNRHPKKESSLHEAETKLKKILDSAPDMSPQSIQDQFQFMRELLPHLANAKASLANRLTIEKKEKKVRALQSQLDNVHGISTQLHQIYNALVHFNYLDQYLFILAKLRFNRDDINECVGLMQTVVKEIFKYPKDGEFDVDNFEIIDLFTKWIHNKLALYEVCAYHGTYKEILKKLPRHLVQQFNTRYFARRRDSAKNTEELKATREYKVMTKKFITLKLEKFYTLQRAYNGHIKRLFGINDDLIALFAKFGEDATDQIKIGSRKSLIQKLGAQLNQKNNASQQIIDGLPRDEDIRKNSIITINGYILNFYYTVLQDAYIPLSTQEMVVNYLKKGDVPEDLTLKASELVYLANPIYSRKEEILKIFYQGIMELVRGETNERAVLKPLMQALNKEYSRNKRDEMWTRAINSFLYQISPDEIALAVDVLTSLPNDMERINTPIGKLYNEVLEKYHTHQKKKVDQGEKVQPTDTPAEKQQKIITDKLERIILKEAEPKIGVPSATDLLKTKKEEEYKALKAKSEQSEMMANYYLAKLIANWKVELEKTIIEVCLGGDTSKLSSKSSGVSRHEMKYINDYFSGEHLIEVEKHLKILSESMGDEYLKHPKPYNKVEYAVFFATKNLMMDYENPAKSYPRTYERLSSISQSKK